MLDLKQIRENPQYVQERLNLRSAGQYDIQPILELDQQQRQLEQERSRLQARSNEIAKLIPAKIKQGSDPKGAEILELREEGNKVKTEIGELEPREKELKSQLETLLLALPNLPSEATPIGKSEDDNPEVRRWGDEYKPQHSVLPHWEIGKS